jgi:hypothetical protein
MAMETGTATGMVTATGTVTAMDTGQRSTGTLTVIKEVLVDMGILPGISRRKGLRGTITNMIMKSARILIFNQMMQRLSSQIMGWRLLSLSISMFGPHSLAKKTTFLIPLLPNCSPASKDQ